MPADLLLVYLEDETALVISEEDSEPEFEGLEVEEPSERIAEILLSTSDQS